MLYKPFAAVIGVMIALMVMINGLFAEQAGYMLSILIIHLVGLATVSLVLVFRREEKKSDAPFYLYLGGLVGIVLLFSNSYCFHMLGASLTLALGITGQAAGSLLIDNFGFLGMKKYPVRAQKLMAIAVSLAGIGLMIEQWRFNLLITVLAFVTGMLVILSMLLNSQLALRVGLFRGTRINFISGLLAIILLIAATRSNVIGSWDTLVTINPVLLLGGGFLGVMVVAGINVVFPKIPAVYSTLLIIIGQLTAGLIIDYVISGSFSVQKMFGVVLVLTGVGINLMTDRPTPLSDNSDISHNLPCQIDRFGCQRM